MQCNKHVVKMLLESVQLLYNVHHVYDDVHRFDTSLKVYKYTHRKHPMTLWTAAAVSHYQWLLRHAAQLAREHAVRYPASNEHVCTAHVRRIQQVGPPPSMPATATLSEMQEHLTGPNLVWALDNPPEGCASAPLCFGKQLAECTRGNPIDLVASYHAYYEWKASHMTMTWGIVCRGRAPPKRYPASLWAHAAPRIRSRERRGGAKDERVCVAPPQWLPRPTK